MEDLRATDIVKRQMLYTQTIEKEIKTAERRVESDILPPFFASAKEIPG